MVNRWSVWYDVLICTMTRTGTMFYSL